MPDALHAALGRRIRERRETSDKTQDKLASEIDISRTSLTNIECGRQRVLIDQLYRIAAALNVQPSELLPLPADYSAMGTIGSGAPTIPASVHRFVQKVKSGTDQ
ncbi:MAG TPA: helix-turn-helix transcriptional regulator [Solimonas sp.]